MADDSTNFHSVINEIIQGDAELWSVAASEQASIAVIVVDLDWHIQFITPAAQSFLAEFSGPAQNRILKVISPLTRNNLPIDEPGTQQIVFFKNYFENNDLFFREIDWNGIPASLLWFYIPGSSENMQIQTAIRICTILSGLSLSNSDWRRQIQIILAHLGQSAQADQVSLFFLPQRQATVVQRRNNGWLFDDFYAQQPQSLQTGPLIHAANSDWENLLANNRPVQLLTRQLTGHQKALFTAFKIQCTLWIPLNYQGQSVGFLQLDRIQEENLWTEAEVAAIQQFAVVMAMRIEREKQEKELVNFFETERKNYAALEILHEISLSLNAIMDVEVVLDRLLGQARQLIPLDAGSVLQLENGSFTRVRKFDSLRVTQNLRNYQPIGLPLIHYPILEQIVSSTKAMRIHSVATEPEWISPEGYESYQSWIGAPIVVESRVIGLLSLYREKDIFTEQHLRLIIAFCEIAARAMTNARLFDNVANTLVHEQRLNEITQIIASSLDLESVLHTILRLTTQLINADSGALALVDSPGRLKVAYLYNIPQELKNRAVSPSESISSEIYRNGYPILLENYSSHPQAITELIADGVHSYLGVPLIAGNETLGVLSLFRKVQNRKFKDQDRFLAEIIARQAGIAIQNANRYEEAHRLATRDSLTNLYNRRHFFELASREFDRARRYSRELTAIMLDLDNLKQINDTFGHQTGDRALQLVAQTCMQSVRRPDLIGRYGGDEFVILLPETNLANAVALGQRLLNCVKQNILENEGAQITLSISLGVAEMIDSMRNLETLIEHADQAQYQAKHSGKGRLNVWGE
jgi:diguanylate cyclase (GGDEF)-like protein